jgi:hypothetical protein
MKMDEALIWALTAFGVFLLVGAFFCLAYFAGGFAW